MSEPKLASLPIEDMRPTRAKHLTKGPLCVTNVFLNLFSKTGKREAPSKNKVLHGRLITIGVSHYCEKGRWGLDLVEADPDNPFYYTEDAHPPPFAAFETVPASGDKASVTPMLVFDDDRTKDGDPYVLCKSDVILKQMCPFLYPRKIEDEILEIEADLGLRLGAGVRCFGYHHLLVPAFYPVLKKLCCSHTSKIETILFDKMLDKGVSKAMRKFIGINEQTSEAGLATVRQVFAEVSDRLKENGGKYLMDTETESYGFTAVDLTFAALASIIVLPPEMIEFQRPKSELPPAVVSLINEVRPTLAAKHALKMYKMHRFGVRAQPIPNTFGAHVVPKSLKRDRFPWLEAAVGVVGIVSAIAFLWNVGRFVFS